MTIDDSFRSAGDLVGRALTPPEKRDPAPMACCPRDLEPLIPTLEHRGAEFR